MTTALIPGGYIMFPRQLQHHEIVHKPPLFLKVYLWLYWTASHKVHGNLERGQLFTSMERMQEAFSYRAGGRIMKPSIRQIRTACEYLTKVALIGTSKVAHGMIVTILNYDYYQTASNYESLTESRIENPSCVTILTRRVLQEERTKEKEKTVKSGNPEPPSADAQKILAYINGIKGTIYKDTSHIEARLKEGFTYDQCIQVVINKQHDAFFMDKGHVNPVTLFKKDKFDVYVNEKPWSIWS